jgi:NAD(P)-dependent dehydrogenase (short-subunit alcohol dehydrogenase family)
MKDRTIAITGAAGALGSALANHLAAAGARVVGVDLSEMKAGKAFEMAVDRVDLTSPDAVQRAFDTIGARFPMLDGLANIAGGFGWETVADGSIATWDRLYAINLKSAVLACQAMLPLLRRPGGSIVNVSAAASQRAESGMGAYAASKAGVSRLTESLAAELKDSGVRVNAVLPSIIDTPANRASMPDADFARWVSQDALSDVIAFLLSDKARAITGALLPVTGRL